MVRTARHEGRARAWRRPATGLVAALLVSVPALGLTACTPGAVFTVTSTTDAVDADPGDGICETAASTCTLRAAIQEANHATVRTRIVLATDATYTFSIGGTSENDAATGDLDVMRDVTIEGHGATIDAAGRDRALQVLRGGALALTDLTITHGSAPSGGGLRVEATARAGLTRVTVSDNDATGVRSCASVGSTQVTCVGDEFGGGGIYSEGTLSLDSSTVSTNRSGLTAGPCHDVVITVGTHQVTGTVCDITTGGGIVSAGSLGVVNSTISGNRAGPSTGQFVGFGGGLYLQRTSALSSVIVSSTIVDNAADVGAAIAGRVSLTTSIVASSTTAACAWSSGDPANVPGPATSLDWNIVSDTSCGISRKHDQVSTDPLLGPLADNGGPTRTHLPSATSPAVDTVGRATVGLCDGTIPDQRGATRPGGRYCDVGAVERQPSDP